MKQEKNVMPEGFRVLNYATSNKTMPITDVPTLVSDKILNALQKEDPTPYYKIEAIEYPVEGTGGVYEPSFFKSFINVLNNRAIPGSKRGHEWLSRPNNDFYMVGGKTVDNGDGTGTAYFKMYIPPKGDGTDNYGFIRDAEAGLVNFSLVTRPEYNVQIDKKTGSNVYHFTASNGGERNDAVEYGAGAMKQVVNSKEVIDFENARELIQNGQFTREDGNELIVNGKVSRPMLRRMVARADCENKAEISELISMIDKQANGGKPVELKEAIEQLKNAAQNGAVSLVDVVKNMGGEKLLRTEADDKAVAFHNSMTKEFGENPAEAITAMKKQNEAQADAIAKNSVTEAFGPEKDNPAHEYAMNKVAGKTGDELKNALDALKDDAVMKGLRANQADPNSGINILQNGGKIAASEIKTY